MQSNKKLKFFKAKTFKCFCNSGTLRVQANIGNGCTNLCYLNAHDSTPNQTNLENCLNYPFGLFWTFK